MLEFASVALVAAVLVALIVTFVRGRRGGGGIRLSEAESGTLYVTGVSPRPEPRGEHYVTITGTLSGPSVRGETVYGRFVWDVDRWPSPGDQLPVRYPPGNPHRWQLGA